MEEVGHAAKESSYTAKHRGIIGLGAIGRRLAELGRAIGMHVIAWTVHPNQALGVELVEFDQLLRSSDVISVHLRLSQQTERMIGAREFRLMKNSAILVNTARGAVVEEEALVDALLTKTIAGAGLDVFTRNQSLLDTLLRLCLTWC